MPLRSPEMKFLSCGDDSVIKIWKHPPPEFRGRDRSYYTPLETYIGEHAFSYARVDAWQGG